MLIDIEDLVAREGMRELLKYSLSVVASVRGLFIYPCVQRHFVKGVMSSSAK